MEWLLSKREQAGERVRGKEKDVCQSRKRCQFVIESTDDHMKRVPPSSPLLATTRARSSSRGRRSVQRKRERERGESASRVERKLREKPGEKSAQVQAGNNRTRSKGPLASALKKAKAHRRIDKILDRDTRLATKSRLLYTGLLISESIRHLSHEHDDRWENTGI